MPRLARELLHAARAHGLHTAMDTAGLCPWEHLEGTAGSVDLFLFDLKHADPERHRALRGVSNEVILDNLRRLNALGRPIWVRVPQIPGLNDAEANDHALGRLPVHPQLAGAGTAPSPSPMDDLHFDWATGPSPLRFQP